MSIHPPCKEDWHKVQHISPILQSLCQSNSYRCLWQNNTPNTPACDKQRILGQNKHSPGRGEQIGTYPLHTKVSKIQTLSMQGCLSMISMQRKLRVIASTMLREILTNTSIVWLADIGVWHRDTQRNSHFSFKYFSLAYVNMTFLMNSVQIWVNFAPPFCKTLDVPHSYANFPRSIGNMGWKPAFSGS